MGFGQKSVYTEKEIIITIQKGYLPMERKEGYVDYTRGQAKHDKDKTSQEKISKFRMGTEEKYQKTLSIKTRLIKKEGGYGGFKRKYGKDPFAVSREEAKKLIQRNQKCFCGSEKKYKRCCLNLNG